VRTDLDTVYLHMRVPQPLGRRRDAFHACTARALSLLGSCSDVFLARLASVYGAPIGAAARLELECRAKLEA
jgi:hypothetical protein